MSRWVLLWVCWLSACLRTEAVELGSDDADATDTTNSEVHDPADLEAEATPPVETHVEESDVREADAETVLVAGSCIVASPTALSFGARRVGEPGDLTVWLTACGTQAVRVSEVALADDGNGRFSIVTTAIGLLRPNESKTIVVRYTADISEPNADGTSTADRGLLVVVSDAETPRLEVPLEGYGTGCPVARIHSAQGPTVPVGIDVQLDGRGSSAALGAIAGYRWTVEAPFGSITTLLPSASVATPTLTLDAEGTYILRLVVTDDQGLVSCVAAEHQVTAVRDMRIYVQLTWHTPGDPNPYDSSGTGDVFSVGSDMDLHFLSPKANGGYFGSFDCYFANPNPEWGIFDPADNPVMNRDDNDGAGPETIGLARPEDDVRYQVGVHYYDDWGYGDSVATVRVYIDGELRDTWSAPVTMDDMWDSHTIDWPSGVVTRIGEVPRITPNYY